MTEKQKEDFIEKWNCEIESLIFLKNRYKYILPENVRAMFNTKVQTMIYILDDFNNIGSDVKLISDSLYGILGDK